MKAKVTERVGPDTCFIPFHFSGWWQGEDMLPYYPEGAAPIVRGEAVNTATTYGYDRVTMMQETKTTLCQVAEGIRGDSHGENEIPVRRRALHRVQRLRHRLQERERGALGREPPPRRHINDGVVGAEKSISVACMHCSDAPCMAVCPVDCFYRTDDGVVLHDKDLCIGCGYCFYACPFGAPQFPQAGAFGLRGKMDKCTFCAGGPEADRSEAEFQKYGRNRLAEGKLPACAEMCSTKALLGGDGDVIADIYRERVLRRGKGSEVWGWGTAYGQGRRRRAAAAAQQASDDARRPPPDAPRCWAWRLRRARADRGRASAPTRASPTARPGTTSRSQPSPRRQVDQGRPRELGSGDQGAAIGAARIQAHRAVIMKRLVSLGSGIALRCRRSVPWARAPRRSRLSTASRAARRKQPAGTIAQPGNNAPVWRNVQSGKPNFTTVRGVDTEVLIQPPARFPDRRTSAPRARHGACSATAR